jgi:hypothetical protein
VTTIPTRFHDDLIIFLFGPGEAEGMAVHLPGGKWCVVDSSAGRAGGAPTDNLILSYLHANDVHEIEFWALTHPHEDHMKGFDAILSDEKIRTKSVLVYDGLGLLEFLAKQGDAIKAWKKLRKDAGKEFGVRRIVTWLERLQKITQDRGIPITRSLQSGETILSYPHHLVSKDGKAGKRVGVSVTVMSPSESDKEVYEESISNILTAADSDALTIETFYRGDPNTISASLCITYGDTNIILGGDVLSGNTESKTGWHGIVCSHPCCATAVKVSHHCSNTSYLPLAWKEHGSPLVLVAPFVSQHLPEDPPLEDIRKCGRAILSTNTGMAMKKREKDFFWQFLAGKMRKLERVPACPTGAIVGGFDSNGNAKYIVMGGSAGEI